MRAPTHRNHYFRGTTRSDNAYFRVGCPCIMHYAFLLCFSYVFYNSEAKVNALFKICIMRLCIMRISTVLDLASLSICNQLSRLSGFPAGEGVQSSATNSSGASRGYWKRWLLEECDCRGCDVNFGCQCATKSVSQLNPARQVRHTARTTSRP